MKTVNIYTDGACRGNPGVGVGVRSLSMEKPEKSILVESLIQLIIKWSLRLLLKGLKALKEPCIVHLTTDSKYVMQGITSWIDNWKKNNWKSSSKKDVKNKDLWIELDKYVEMHDVKWSWVKGHSGHEQNEIADQLANKGIDTL